jgi:hypothetical protein
VVLVPVVATEIAPALAHDKPAVTLPSASPAAPARSPQLAAAPSRRSTSPVAAPGALTTTARPRQRGPRLTTATEAPGMTLAPSSPAAAAGSQEPPPATSTAPPLSPPPVKTPATGPVGVSAPSLQPPPVLPPAATEPLDALTSVLSGATNALPVGK